VRDSDDEEADVELDTQPRDEEGVDAVVASDVDVRDGLINRTFEDVVLGDLLDELEEELEVGSVGGEGFGAREEHTDVDDEDELRLDQPPPRTNGKIRAIHDQIRQRDISSLSPSQWNVQPTNVAGSRTMTSSDQRENLGDVSPTVASLGQSSKASTVVVDEGMQLDDIPRAPPAHRTEVQVVIPVLTGYGEEMEDQEVHGPQVEIPTRNLRHRNPIQQRPYTIDEGRYRQTMYSVGVRPVRIPNQSQQRGQEEDRTHEEPVRARSYSPVVARHRARQPSDTALPFSPVVPAVVSRRLPNDHLDFGDRDDLPDWDTVLARTQHSTNKRRKIHRTYSARSDGLKSPAANHLRNTNRTRPTTEDSDSLEIPLSPPPTSALQSPSLPHKHSTTGFRFPPGFSPQRLPTPELSSSAMVGIEPDRDDPSEPESDAPPLSHRSVRFAVRQPPGVQTISSSSSSSSSSESDSSEEIRGIQRKIKGVLPASWLKLDLKKRAGHSKSKAQSPKRTQIRQDQRETHLGVAKKRLAPPVRRPGSPQSLVQILSSDHSESDSESEDLPFAAANHLSKPQSENHSLRPLLRTASPHLDDDPGDQMEDNAIERMNPSTARPRHRPTTKQKRQATLKDSFQSLPKRLKTGQPSNFKSKKSKPRGANNSGPLGRSKERPPRLSIVDVVEDKSATPDIPQFLKIAARQARKALEYGRQSPTQKSIRLQTRQDTADANSVLGDWRAGKIRQRSPPQRLKGDRAPFAERSHNQQNDQGLQHPISLDKPKERIQSTRNLRQTRLQPILQKSNQLKSRHRIHTLGKSLASLKLSKKSQRVYQAAQLEADENEMDIPNDSLRFQQHLRKVDRDFNVLHGDVSLQNPQLAAFINGDIPMSNIPELPNLAAKGGSRVPVHDESRAKRRQPSALQVRKSIRKRPARRLDIEVREYRQPDGLFLLTSEQSTSVEAVHFERPILQDLGPVGTQFTQDFDVLPLPTGTYFHSTTFIGSGDFRRSLFMDHRSLDADAGRHVVILGGQSCAWSQWDDEMATTVHEVFAKATADLESLTIIDDSSSAIHGTISGVVLVLHQIIRLNSSSLSFFDSVDRSSCVTKFMDSMEPLQIVVVQILETSIAQAALKRTSQLLIRVVSSMLALARQLLIVAQHSTVLPDVPLRVCAVLKSLSEATYRFLVWLGFEDIEIFIDDNQRHAIREAGIRDDRPAVEACFVLRYVLETSNIAGFSFWNMFNSESISDADNYTKAGTFERKWRSLYAVLPLLELNSNGVLQVGHRFQHPSDNWDYVKPLLSRVFSLYAETAAQPGANINSYIRTLLRRCHNLIRGWGWRKCELIIGAIFDFFANNGLAPLRNEDVRGSPQFLEVLHRHPSLDLLPEDSAFHIFLKIVGNGLKDMYGLLQDRKIQSIAWRCIPNHNRRYDKHQDLLETDLAALRNHHDLMCTLYYACPPGFRLRVDNIQSLVDHTTSHREACRLNIKSWTNLVKFQLSTNEPLEKLEPFISWFRDIVEQTINQYKEARSEAETQYENLRRDGEALPSADALKRNISRNQNLVLASLIDAIAGMGSAVRSTSDQIIAAELVQKSGIERIFSLFDAKTVRANSALIEVLRVYSALVELRSQATGKPESQPASDESQNYGEWPESPENNIDFVIEPLTQFLSNCFGAETAPDDNLLTVLVDSWTKIAGVTVQAGEKDWTSFLDSFSAHSWNQLRDTEQKRKLGPYFLSLVAECDRNAFYDNRSIFISAWLVSLVEREARLKFQNRLTTALLKIGFNDELLRNLPFVMPLQDEVIEISSMELRERRLALLSSVFSNMRDHFDDISRYQPQVVRELRQEYSTYLRQLMATMKNNYLELQQGETVTGAYITFVQSIVEFLQQYTSDICPVDSFFTDSSVFPLPAKDPTYVVGRLKGYGAKLGDTKVVKQLASFIQNVSKRAAVDNEQTYLVDQLHTAMSNSLENGNQTQPRLRTLLVQGIFPTYIEASIKTPSGCGWIVAKPILQSCTRMFDDFMYDFSATDDASVGSALQVLSAMLAAVHQAVSDLTVHPELLQHRHVVRTLNLLLQTTTAVTPSLDYIIRRTARGKELANYITYMKAIAIFAAKVVLGHDDAIPPPDIESMSYTAVQPPLQDIRDFCKKELCNDLSKNWSRDCETHFVFVPGSGKKEVFVDLGTFEDERDLLISSVEEYFTLLDRMKALR
jgi:hypothetical protein